MPSTRLQIYFVPYEIFTIRKQNTSKLDLITDPEGIKGNYEYVVNYS